MRGLKFRGRPPIRIAGSVLDVVNFSNPYAAQILDRTATIDQDFVDAIVAQSVFTWVGRNPTPALDQDGRFQGTDLDLLSFMAPLAARGAVIELPKYKNFRPRTTRSDERHVGGGSRFGPLVGLTSNKDVFSMSARVFDSTVVKRDPATGRETPGAFRNFMLVSPAGVWHKGWEQIIFSPTAAENAFLREQRLLTGNTVYFRNAVHPNRWQSIFGAPYLLLKMLIERTREESSFYRRELKRLEAKGIFPSKERGEGYSASSATMQKVKVETLEVVLDLPVFTGSYPEVSLDVAGADYAYERQKLLTYSLQPEAQFIVRSDELAYFLHGDFRIASWMTGRTWKTGYRVPRGRVDWNQMVLSNDVALRLRTKTVTEDAAVDFIQSDSDD